MGGLARVERGMGMEERWVMMVLTDRAEEQRGGWARSVLEKALAELSGLHHRNPFW